MPTNDFIGFASGGSANVMSQVDYAAAAEQTDGVQPGPASSELANKIWRQGANMAAALAQVVNTYGFDTLDNGDINTLSTNISSAIKIGKFTKLYFSQSSGSFTAPNDGIYKITLKGGGGGGGGARLDAYNGGGGGGAGCLICFYTSLVKNQVYPYVIGAGGAAGTNANNATATAGSVGGSTIFNNDISAVGGAGGYSGSSTNGGGGGNGGASTAPANGYRLQGARGQSGAVGMFSSGFPFGPTIGGDYPSPGGGGMGGGQNGSLAATDPTDGRNGYILIEYNEV